MKIINANSPNFSSRSEATIINAIIIHYTVISLQETLEKFADPRSEVSSHFLIAKTGDIYQFIDEEMKAWHAGESYWNSMTALNNNSIGIELENSGHEEFSQQLIASLLDLLNYLKTKYNINNHNIIGHSDIAPARKQDPGKLFPWAELAKNNLGLYLLDNVIHNKSTSSNYQPNIKQIQTKLSNFGYKLNVSNIIDQNTIQVVKAFNDHFYPEIYNKYSNLANTSSVFLWDDSSDLILDYLLQAKTSTLREFCDYNN